jgi:hypothetical protein
MLVSEGDKPSGCFGHQREGKSYICGPKRSFIPRKTRIKQRFDYSTCIDIKVRTHSLLSNKYISYMFFVTLGLLIKVLNFSSHLNSLPLPEF